MYSKCIFHALHMLSCIPFELIRRHHAINDRPGTKSLRRGKRWLPGLVAWKHDVDLVIKFPSSDINGLWGSEISESY